VSEGLAIEAWNVQTKQCSFCYPEAFYTQVLAHNLYSKG